MLCIVVAAGIGTRLYPFSDIVPKVMFPVGKRQLPVGHHIINHCKDYGIDEFVFALNKVKGRQAINYFGNGARFGVDITYSLSKNPLGTAGELKMAWSQGLVELPSLIYYGDTLCSTDLHDLMLFHARDGGDVSVVVNDNIRIPVGYVEDMEGQIVRILEKPKLSEIITMSIGGFTSGGILPIFYVTNEDFFKTFCHVGKDVVNDVIQEMLGTGYNVLAYHDKNPFIDVGNFKNLRLANETWP